VVFLLSYRKRFYLKKGWRANLLKQTESRLLPKGWFANKNPVSFIAALIDARIHKKEAVFSDNLITSKEIPSEAFNRIKMPERSLPWKSSHPAYRLICRQNPVKDNISKVMALYLNNLHASRPWVCCNILLQIGAQGARDNKRQRDKQHNQREPLELTAG